MIVRSALCVALVVALAGCSFFRANCVNDPLGTCSQKTVIVDYAIAGLSVGAGTAVYLAAPCDIEGHDCKQLDVLTRVLVPAVVVGVTALASAIYGGSVVDRCERLQRRSRRR